VKSQNVVKKDFFGERKEGRSGPGRGISETLKQFRSQLTSDVKCGARRENWPDASCGSTRCCRLREEVKIIK